MALQVDITKKLYEFTLKIKFDNEDNCLGILGASGCGKSMTLKSIAGIVTPDSGRIVLDDKVLYDSEKRINLSPQERNIGYLFQNYALFPNMTVSENIKIGLSRLGMSKREKQKKVEEMVEQFRLTGLENRYPAKLSGGQQQRVALARILAYDPDVLLLDEPFSAMDAFLREELLIELTKVLKSYGSAAILVTHNREEVYRLSNELMIMDRGTVLKKGETKELFINPEHFLAARLTGCKNIPKAVKSGEFEVEVPEWGITLHTNKPVPDNLSAIGIRAHDFYVVSEEAVKENKVPINTFNVEMLELIETPFEWNIILKTSNFKGDDEKQQIWWKLGKEIREHVNSAFIPKYIAVKPDSILLIK